MKAGQVSYQTKLKMLKKQYKLYDEFLVEEKPNEKDRYKLIDEMGRISALINQINNMTVEEFFCGADDYFKEFESKKNPKKRQGN
mgnify:CR=1 FL=1